MENISKRGWKIAGKVFFINKADANLPNLFKKLLIEFLNVIDGKEKMSMEQWNIFNTLIRQDYIIEKGGV